MPTEEIIRRAPNDLAAPPGRVGDLQDKAPESNSCVSIQQLIAAGVLTPGTRPQARPGPWGSTRRSRSPMATSCWTEPPPAGTSGDCSTDATSLPCAKEYRREAGMIGDRFDTRGSDLTAAGSGAGSA